MAGATRGARAARLAAEGIDRELQGAADRVRRRRLARAVADAVEALESAGRGDVARELTEALYQREHPSPVPRSSPTG